MHGRKTRGRRVRGRASVLYYREARISSRRAAERIQQCIRIVRTTVDINNKYYCYHVCDTCVFLRFFLFSNGKRTRTA